MNYWICLSFYKSNRSIDNHQIIVVPLYNMRHAKQTISRFFGKLKFDLLLKQFQKNRWRSSLDIGDKGVINVCFENKHITIGELQWKTEANMLNKEKSYYFQSSPDAELQHLNNRNLEEAYHNTRWYDNYLSSFLILHSVTMENPRTKQLKFIEFLNKIDL